jgi:hypothetical protein
MPKLTKQQIILLVAMALAVFYGAFDLLFSSSPTRPAADYAQKSTELKSFYDDTILNITKSKPSDFYLSVAAKAETDWGNDPFYDRKTYRAMMQLKDESLPGEATEQSVSFIYTGYLQLEGKKMAVINGMEYGVGESLETEGYLLREIYPTKVVIMSRADRIIIEIPLQE